MRHLVKEAPMFDHKDLFDGHALLAANSASVLGFNLCLTKFSINHCQLVEQQRTKISLVLFLKQALMPINEDHEVVSCQIQLECLACSVVKCDDTDQFKWQIALQKVNCEVLVCYHT